MCVLWKERKPLAYTRNKKVERKIIKRTQQNDRQTKVPSKRPRQKKQNSEDELDLHGKVLVVGGRRSALCEQSPALLHIRSQPAPATSKETCCWAMGVGCASGADLKTAAGGLGELLPERPHVGAMCYWGMGPVEQSSAGVVLGELQTPRSTQDWLGKNGILGKGPHMEQRRGLTMEKLQMKKC